MRRKGDMFKGFADREGASFLPGEGEQEATTAAVELRERLAKVEEQLRSQFTSIAAYAQISQQAVETARAESRADLDREKATIISLLERLRDETAGIKPRPAVDQNVDGSMDAADLARVEALEEKLDRLSGQFAEVLRSQEELANSIAFMIEHQMRASGWVPNCADATN